MEQANVPILIDHARHGDQDAFGALMEMHKNAIFRVAFRLTGDEASADSVTQDTFVQAFRSLNQFQGRSQFKTWLYAIAVRKAADQRRESIRKRATKSLDITGGENMHMATTRDPSDVLQGKEFEQLLSAAITRLPEDQRAALVLVAQEKMSYRDAARALDCSEGTVAWRVWNARRLLKTMMKDHLPNFND